MCAHLALYAWIIFSVKNRIFDQNNNCLGDRNKDFKWIFYPGRACLIVLYTEIFYVFKIFSVLIPLRDFPMKGVI